MIASGLLIHLLLKTDALDAPACLFTQESVCMERRILQNSYPERAKSNFYNNLGDRIQQGKICHKDTEAKMFVTKFQNKNNSGEVY